MLNEIKNATRKIFSRPSRQLSESDVAKARQYIEEYWQHLERYHPKDDDNLIGLPNPYLVPSFQAGHEFDYNELYYWDSYFMVQGLLDKKHQKLVEGILDNLIHLYKRFKIIPNGSRLYYVSRSHPPFLTSFIFDVYDAYKKDRKWLQERITVAMDEYTNVWLGTRKPNARQVYMGLSRYYDFNYLNDLAEAESGWDMTTRFNRNALNYLPVDLNSLLYKYESDFARAAKILGNDKEASVWLERAHTRKQLMDDLMWNKVRGFYYDYNYAKKRKGNVTSLAGFFPMWAGMVNDKRAAQLVKALRRFENRGGLSTTDRQDLNQIVPGGMPLQWAYPNGWAPLHYIVIKGLERYGYHEDAERIATKWLNTNLAWFNRHGIFLEKYNVVNPDKPPQKGLYPSQTGFGWTNSVFEKLCQTYVDK